MSSRVLLCHILLLVFAPSIVQGRLRWEDDDSVDYTFPKGIALTDGATFDYIVVGAGAAGSAAAARLALTGAEVLLTEAGGDPPPSAKIPGAVISLVGTSYDWAYKTISNNKSCLSFSCQYNRGKCLGGSTSINHMLYTRGNRKDYDYDLPGWSWQDLKPYFLRYEGLQDLDRLPSSSKPYHNTSGLVKLSLFDDTQSPWHSRIIEGYRHLNFPLNEDVNGESQIGVGFIPGYVHDGERMSTARAFLARDDVKINLRVAKHALCTGVIIDDDNDARGVKVVQRPSRKTLHIYARKEVILSAGTVGTPHILMLSGVGPAAHLKEMGVPIRADLPVGESISEHIVTPLFLLVDRSPGLAGDLAMFTEKARDLTQYATSREGPLTSIGLVDIGMFVNTHCYNSSARRLEVGHGCELPNLQMIHLYIDRYVFMLARSLFERQDTYTAHVVDQLVAASAEYALMIMSPINLVPHSRGSIHLASADPLETPAIYPNFLSDAQDVDEALRSISVVEDLLETPAFRSQKAKILHLELPGCPQYNEDREGYWRCYVRHMTAPGLHAVGSAALGRVLDSRLRVRGVSRLRVADASAIPTVPRGSTEAAAIAFGERVVDFLLEDNEPRYR